MNDEAPSNVHPWDGTGPKEECLLRIKWAGSGQIEWMHFDWRDGVDDSEDTVTCQYFNEPSAVDVREANDGTFTPYKNFTITHWTSVPVVDAGGSS